jgi:tetratricopeptide (TPR) repeat protein
VADLLRISSLSIAPEDPVLIYNLACVRAREGKTKEALNFLKKAFTLQPNLTATASKDSDLVSLYELPEFKALLERQYIASAPAEVVDVFGELTEINLLQTNE